MKLYNEELLKNDLAANCHRPYQQCTLSVMDTIADPDITFDEHGICNYYYEYQETAKKGLFTGDEGLARFNQEIDLIKADGKGKAYDCILGVSGGVDSSYMTYLAKREGLRPLIVHFDNGWNSEAAVSNIENVVKACGFDLYTYVINWHEFKEVQRAYFKASVIDLEVPTDQFIFGALMRLSRRYNVKYILSGWNIRTEAVLPKAFFYRRKFDSENLLDIVAQFGDVKKHRKLPTITFRDQLVNYITGRVKIVSLLNYIDYNKSEVKDFLTKEFGWRDYGGKHHESVFTRFYQGYILPVKFNIDKRKCHLSNLIFSGQITKEEALSELKQPPYDLNLQKQDFEYVAKKLGFTILEFEAILSLPPRQHNQFKSDVKYWNMYQRIIKPVKPLAKFFGVRPSLSS